MARRRRPGSKARKIGDRLGSLAYVRNVVAAVALEEVDPEPPQDPRALAALLDVSGGRRVPRTLAF